MITIAETRADDQARRLRQKSQDQRLINLAVEGAGISPWEAQVLTGVVNEVYFAEAEDRPLQCGQMRYTCVALSAGAGLAIARCPMKTVVLTIIDADDPKIDVREGASGLRRHKILRLTEEAREQGGVLTQEDLAQLLACDVRTIRRDIQEFRTEHEIIVATRGQLKDIGPTVSHKGIAIRHWLDGAEPVDVARKINHTLAAVERYIQHFSRVVYLKRREFTHFEISLTCGLSTAGVKTYLDIYDSYRDRKEFWSRFKEIDLVGETHYQAADEKKGAHSPSPRPRNGGSRP